MPEHMDAREAPSPAAQKANSLRMHRWIAEFIKRHHGDVYDRACREFVASSEFAAIAARTPESAGDSEPTDVRELRERLERAAELTADWDSWRAGDVCSACMDATAALDRLEALEAYYRANEDARAHRTGAQRWEPGAFDALTDAQRRRDEARARLATPAPAPQGGEE